MQQTQTYKLNLIEPHDPFLPDGLNANTQKIEDVLSAREAANDGKLAEMDGRVTALEAHKFYVGTYTGDGDGIVRKVELGFTPIAVCMAPYSSSGHFHWAFTGVDDPQGLYIVEGGFQVGSDSRGGHNSKGKEYHFFVFT